MRKRFANNFRQVVDFGLGRTRDPRCLRISSVLLMNASRIVLREFVDNIDFRLRNAAKDVPILPHPVTPNSYENFIQGMNGMITSLNTFFQAEPREGEDIGSIVEVVESLLEVLQQIKKVSGLVVQQGKNQYRLFSDEKIKKITIEFLKELEIKNIQSLLKKDMVKKELENENNTDILRDFNNAFREILKNLQAVDRDMDRKIKNKVPMLDASEKYSELKYASEGEVA